MIATLCMLVMVAGCVLNYTGPLSNVNSASASNDTWNMFLSEEGENIVDAGGKVYKAVSDAGVALPAAAQDKDCLELYVKVWLKDASAVDVMKNTYVELANTTVDKQELSWALSGQALVPGMNEVTLKLSNGTSYEGGEGPFDVTQTINFFRFYTSTAESVTATTVANGIKLYEVSIKNTNAEGLLFGLNDTHLQLENKLEEAPEAIEASVKADKVQDEWVLRSAQSNSWSYNLDQVATYHTIEEGEGPTVGVSYANAPMVKDQTFGFVSKFALNIPEYYTDADVALDFWFKVDEIESDLGVIELSSSGSYGNKELYWHVEKYTKEMVAGEWYHVVLPLTGRTGTLGSEPFVLQEVNYLRWYGAKITAEQANYSCTDIKLVVISEEDDSVKWPLLTAGTQLENAATYYNGNNTVSTGTVIEGENGPKVGTSYTQVDVVAGQEFGFQNKYRGIASVPTPGKYDVDDLSVKFWMWCDNPDAMPTTYLSLSTEGWRGTDAATWTISNLALNEGWNYVELRLDEAAKKSGFDYKNIRYIGVYASEPWNDELGKYAPLPVTADCSFKMTDIELVVRPDYNQEYNTIFKAGSTLDAAGQAAADSEFPGQTISNGYVTGEEANEFTPAEGTAYTQFDVEAGAKLCFRNAYGTLNQGFPITSKYDRSELAIGFWLYNESGVALPSWSTINLSSGKWTGTSEAYIYIHYLTKLQQGWNYIEIPLSDTNWTNTGGGDAFDYQNINFFQFYWKTALEEANTFKVTDVRLVPLREVTETRTLANIRNAREVANGRTTGWWYGMGNMTLLQSTRLEENVPEPGTNYVKIDMVEGKNRYSINNKFSYRVPKGYTMDDIAVSLWVYFSEETKLSGNKQLMFHSVTSGTDNNAIYWKEMVGKTYQKGWNHIVLKFSDATQVGTFDLQEMCYMRWHGNGISNVPVTMCMSDIKIIALNEPYRVSTSEVADTTTLKYNKMIFSNINAEGETSPYALYVDTQGYPTLLWGTTAFTLNMDVCTGKWVDIKAVRNADKTVSFYIDGELIATSSSKDLLADDELNFVTAHRIAADGAGAQLFGGNIANLKIYSDAEATTCVGSWALSGDIQDILIPMEDASENKNDAVYRGSRAEDWIDYDKTQYEFLYNEEGEEDYWSMVFIPDLQNLTEGTWQETWLTMADWIADNVETENIVHVMGAGDTTWSDSGFQYEYAREGFDKFMNKVSWSNVPGNHDYVWNATYRDSSKYQQYFGESVLTSSASKDTYVGYFEDPQGRSTTENSYYRFNVNGVQWMVLQLEYHPRLTVLSWMQDIIAQYPNDNVIVTTHGYIDNDGNYIKESMNYINDTAEGDGENYITTTEEIWNHLKDFTNVKMILCGHCADGTGSVGMRVELNSAGEEVPAYMINAQDMDWGSGKGPGYYTNKSLGMLGILRFSADGTRAAMQYYAPQYDKTYNPASADGVRRSNFTLSQRVEEALVEEAVVAYEDGFKAGKQPSDVKNYNKKGLVFAGWFIDEACTKALTKDNQGTVEVAYAKYVDEKVLGVQAQLSEDMGDGKRDIRFVTTVDSVNYKNVGFYISYDADGDGVSSLFKKISNKVYNFLLYINDESGETMEYYPDKEFSRLSKFFMATTVKNVPESHYDMQFKVTPFWITQDGTTVKGTPVYKSVNMGIENSLNETESNVDTGDTGNVEDLFGN